MLYFIYTGKLSLMEQMKTPMDQLRVKTHRRLPEPTIQSTELPCKCDTVPRGELAVFRQIMYVPC